MRMMMQSAVGVPTPSSCRGPLTNSLPSLLGQGQGSCHAPSGGKLKPVSDSRMCANAWRERAVD